MIVWPPWVSAVSPNAVTAGSRGRYAARVSKELSAAVAEEVRRLLDERRWTGRELARRIGASPTSMATKLRGDARLDFEDLAKIATECEVSVAYIVARAEAAVAHSPG